MTDEIKNVEQQEDKCNCICRSKYFKKFLIIAGGSFVGVFCAFSLFSALHKPPMMYPGAFSPRMMKPAHCHCYHMKHHYKSGIKMHRGEFDKKHFDKRFEKKFENKFVQERNKAENDK